MPTFFELQKELSDKRFEKTILDRLVGYLDENFLVPDPSKKLVLITDDRVAVTEEAIEEVIEKLNKMRKTLDDEITTILNTSLAPKEK